MVNQKEITLPTLSRGMHLITNIIVKELPELPDQGLMNLFLLHTSAALSINENFDPTVQTDLNNFFNQLAPDSNYVYAHDSEGSDDMPAHIKSSVVGVSITIPIQNKKLKLGTWQGIYLCEFRSQPQHRKILVTIVS